MVHVGGEAELGDRSRGVASTDHREPPGGSECLGHHPRPGSEARILEHPHRAVPEDRARSGDLVGELGRRTGPDVEAPEAVGDIRTDVDHLATRRRVADLPARPERHDVGGHDDAHPRVQQPATRVDLVGLEQGVPHLVTLGGEEREAHAATDEHRVGDLPECLDHAELVGDLRPAEHDDERPPGVAAQREQDVDLALQQAAGR